MKKHNFFKMKTKKKSINLLFNTTIIFLNYRLFPFEVTNHLTLQAFQYTANPKTNEKTKKRMKTNELSMIGILAYIG
jgi:hypothetical protein